MAKEVMGTVKWFDEKKGYGFLRTDGIDTDIFCHYKHILGEGFKTLSRNELVTFEAVDTSKGIMAVNIKKLVHE
jgi:cold shock protein